MRPPSWLIVVVILLFLVLVLALVRPQPGTATTTAWATTTLKLVVEQPTTVTFTAIETVTSTVTVHETVALRQVDAVCFSRVQSCDSLIVGLIDGASRSVYVMMYSFTSDEIANALIRAKNRGVEVKVVIESQQAGVRGSEYERLLGSEIEVRLDGNPSLMHHKVMIVDGVIVVTGSYNWSRAAENDNDENLIIIKDPSIAAAYEEEFKRVWAQATA
ncbi:Phospholipase D [Candidatus Calditenuaceae archaeon HR02]|nr:Phospholipase D [Candidatus Calditenuaceae archaeon HR02]